MVTKKVSKNKEMIFGDLFGGAGGLSIGFHMAGFKSTFFNEIDKIAANTHSFNFPETKAFVCGIEDLNANIIKKESNLGDSELDIMVGGPPCQGFSINAPIRDVKDPRNSLFNHYARLVLEGLRPKFILMENVPGLISLDHGKTLNNVIKSFEKAGYKIIFKILNSAHYGVPEERWRLFILGTRLDNVSLSFPEPTHYSLQRPNFTGGKFYTFNKAIRNSNQYDLFTNNLLDPTTVKDAIDDLPIIDHDINEEELPYRTKPLNSYQSLLRKGSKKVYNHYSAKLSKINLERLSYVKPGGSWRDIPFDLLPNGLKRARRSDHTKRYGRLDPDSLSGTILTKCDPHWGTFFHYNQDRIISVREAARIQSFPDWFRFIGSKTEQYRCVGNAVPPLLAYSIAKHIISIIKNKNVVHNNKSVGLM